MEEDVIFRDVKRTLKFLDGLGQGLVLGIAEALTGEIACEADPNRVGIRFKRMIANIRPSREGCTQLLILPRRANLQLSIHPATAAGAIDYKMEVRL